MAFKVNCPYVPVKADPTVPAVPEPSVLPTRMDVTVKVEESSASLSLSSTTSLDPSLTVNVSPSFTVPVSFEATGASLIPVTVIAKTAVSVCEPLVTV